MQLRSLPGRPVLGRYPTVKIARFSRYPKIPVVMRELCSHRNLTSSPRPCRQVSAAPTDSSSVKLGVAGLDQATRPWT